MFGKLIKAEWRASRRVVGLLCLAVLAAACFWRRPTIGRCMEP